MRSLLHNDEWQWRVAFCPGAVHHARLTDLSSYCRALHLRAVMTQTRALRYHSFMTMTFFSNHASAKELLLVHNLKHPRVRHTCIASFVVMPWHHWSCGYHCTCSALRCHKIWKWLMLLMLELVGLCCATQSIFWVYFAVSFDAAIV